MSNKAVIGSNQDSEHIHEISIKLADSSGSNLKTLKLKSTHKVKAGKCDIFVNKSHIYMVSDDIESVYALKIRTVTPDSFI